MPKRVVVTISDEWRPDFRRPPRQHKAPPRPPRGDPPLPRSEVPSLNQQSSLLQQGTDGSDANFADMAPAAEVAHPEPFAQEVTDLYQPSPRRNTAALLPPALPSSAFLDASRGQQSGIVWQHRQSTGNMSSSSVLSGGSVNEAAEVSPPFVAALFDKPQPPAGVFPYAPHRGSTGAGLSSPIASASSLSTSTVALVGPGTAPAAVTASQLIMPSALLPETVSQPDSTISLATVHSTDPIFAGDPSSSISAVGSNFSPTMLLTPRGGVGRVAPVGRGGYYTPQRRGSGVVVHGSSFGRVIPPALSATPPPPSSLSVPNRLASPSGGVPQHAAEDSTTLSRTIVWELLPSPTVVERLRQFRRDRDVKRVVQGLPFHQLVQLCDYLSHDGNLLAALCMEQRGIIVADVFEVLNSVAATAVEALYQFIQRHVTSLAISQRGSLAVARIFEACTPGQQLALCESLIAPWSGRCGGETELVPVPWADPCPNDIAAHLGDNPLRGRLAALACHPYANFVLCSMARSPSGAPSLHEAFAAVFHDSPLLIYLSGDKHASHVLEAYASTAAGAANVEPAMRRILLGGGDEATVRHLASNTYANYFFQNWLAVAPLCSNDRVALFHKLRPLVPSPSSWSGVCKALFGPSGAPPSTPEVHSADASLVASKPPQSPLCHHVQQTTPQLGV